MSSDILRSIVARFSCAKGGIAEQALVLNVEGKGLVAIVGCGHQTVPKLLQRLQDAFAVSLVWCSW